MVGIQIGKEQEERKREDEGLNFETTPWWNFITIMGYADEELRSASLLKLRAQPTAKAKAMCHVEGRCASYEGWPMHHTFVEEDSARG